MSKFMITKQELEQFDLTHDHAGNGYAMVEDFGDDYCRVVHLGKNQVGNQAFMAWKPKLKVTTELEDFRDPKSNRIAKLLNAQLLSELDVIRRGIKCGEIKVVNTRFVKA